MCGIIAVARRPQRPRPRRRPTSCSALVERAPALLADRPARDRRRRVDVAADRLERRPTALLRGAPGRPGAARPTGAWSPALDALARRASAARLADHRGRPRRTAPRRPDRRPRGGQRRRSSALKDAAWAVAARPAPHRPGGRRPGRARRRRGRHRGLHRRSSWRCRPSTASRCGAATRPACTLLVRGHGLDLDVARPVAAARGRGSSDPLFASGVGAGRRTAACSFVYKAAAEIGELGDNTAALRAAIRRRRAAAPGRSPADGAEVTVLGHTRWASVGIISQANAHPLNADEVDRVDGPYVTAALNGDVDNFADLKAARRAAHRRRDHHRRQGHPDARVAGGSPRGDDPAEAFRRTVAALRGLGGHRAPAPPTPRPAAARPAGQRPGPLRRPRRRRLRRGQRALRRGRGERHATCAWTARRRPTRADPTGSRGQVVVLDGAPGRHARGHRAASPTTAPTLPVDRATSCDRAEITTRDIDRGDYPHFLLKEISEAPGVVPQDAAGQARRAPTAGSRSPLGPETLPDDAPRAACADGIDPPGPRHRPGHRGGRRPEPRRARWPRPPPAPACGSRPCSPPSCPASGCAPT